MPFCWLLVGLVLGWGTPETKRVAKTSYKMIRIIVRTRNTLVVKFYLFSILNWSKANIKKKKLHPPHTTSSPSYDGITTQF